MYVESRPAIAAAMVSLPFPAAGERFNERPIACAVPEHDFLQARRGLVAGPALHYVSKTSAKANKTMQIRDGSRRSHRPHAADQARTGVGRDRLHHPRQGRVHESRRLGEGPARPPDDPGGREARRAQARRPRGRGHRRQHRHRPCARRQRARLSHADRHPQHPEPGKEGHAAALRRRAGRGAGPALLQSRQLPACRAPPRRQAAQDREERRAVRRPVEQPRQPPGALPLDRPGNLGARPTARSTASSARSAPAARSPAPRSSCARRRRTS